MERKKEQQIEYVKYKVLEAQELKKLWFAFTDEIIKFDIRVINETFSNNLSNI